MRKKFLSAFALLLALLNITMRAWADDSEIFIKSDLEMEISAEQDPQIGETMLGDYCADAIRHMAGTDVALLPASCLQKGIENTVVRESDLLQVLSTQTVEIFQVTGSQLWALLEQSVSHITTGEDERIDGQLSEYEGFMQISGLCFRYDASAKPGNRVLSVETEAGDIIEQDDENCLTVASMQGTEFSGDTVFSVQDTVVFDNLLFSYAQSQDGIHSPETGRIKVIGNNPSLFDEYLSVWTLLGIIGIWVLIRMLFPKKFSYDDGLPE